MINESDFEFLRAVWSRRVLFTYIFFALNITIFILMELAGGTTNESTLIAFGVKANTLIDNGEIWRFLTPVFIHIGLLHLFFNSYALWIVGPQVEKLYGGPRFVIQYVLTGVAGAVASYIYNPYAISAGASGAIFGLFGVLLMFGIRNRRHVPGEFRRAVGKSVLPIIIINLVIGFMIPAIDNSAHLGGLIAGMALATVIPIERPGVPSSPFFAMLQQALFAAIAVSFVMVAVNYDGPSLSVRNLAQGWGDWAGVGSSADNFIDTVNSSQQKFNASLEALDSGDLSEIESAGEGVAESIDQLQRIPSMGSRPDALSGELLRIMQDQYELLQDVQRAGTVTLTHSRGAARNSARYREVMADLVEWVRSERL